MRRFSGTAALLLFFNPMLLLTGCNYSGYEDRIQKTELQLQDEIVLDQSLKLPEAGDFATHRMVLRVPLELRRAGPFSLVANLPPGYFEVANSFENRGDGGSGMELHVLARREGGQSDEDNEGETPAERGDFRSDLAAIIDLAFGGGASATAPESVSIPIRPRVDGGAINYEVQTLNAPNGSLVQIYTLQQEAGGATYEVALIWIFPSGSRPEGSNNPVEVSLGTLAVNQEA